MTLMSNPDVPRWRSVPKSEFVWSKWGDDFVVYHRPSGNTHYLNASSEFLLTHILLSPLDAEAVATEFSRDVANDGDALSAKDMSVMLEQFEHIGLVERL